MVPRWSADGRSIYFSSDQTGRMEIWAVPAEGGALRQITHDGGFAGAPSRDGESLYYCSNNAPLSALWELHLSTGERTLISSSVVNRAFAPAPRGVYFFSGSPKRNSLYFFDKRSLTKTFLFQADTNVGAGLTLSPDQRFLYYVQMEESGELLLVNQFWKN